MPIHIIFVHKYFISEPDFKKFLQHFTTIRLQKDDNVIYFLVVFQKSEILKKPEDQWSCKRSPET